MFLVLSINFKSKYLRSNLKMKASGSFKLNLDKCKFIKI